MKVKAWIEQNYYGTVDEARLDSTEEAIEELLCPLCNGDVTVFDTADYGKSATHAGQLITISYKCDKCGEVFEDGLHVVFK